MSRNEFLRIIPQKLMHRARKTPRVDRPWRTKSLSELTTFYRNRFYEIDSWYKARIPQPFIYPDAYVIDPEQFHQSLADRLKDFNANDPAKEKVDIGFASKISHSKTETKAERLSRSADLERLARLRKLVIDPEQIDIAGDVSEFAEQACLIMQHFGIFRDLFHEDAFFKPTAKLSVAFESVDQSTFNPVFYGNVIRPTECMNMPKVEFECDPNELYSLVAINLDGNLFEDGKEVVQWFVTNIPNCEISKGQTVIPYLPPIAARGTGWHRVVYVLFKQNAQFDPEFCDFEESNLSSRTISFPEFYLNNQDIITPVVSMFYQTAWDESCKKLLHHKFNLEDPLYDYEWPTSQTLPQEEFKKFAAFDSYLDTYRDEKDIEQEILEKRLSQLRPLDGEVEIKRLKYPNLLNERDLMVPSWLSLQRERENLGVGKYKKLYRNRIEQIGI